jgi:UDP-N-acetylmuramoyl-L-alanyl-D-glutamate--2,6-diaminopimelate ligase
MSVAENKTVTSPERDARNRTPEAKPEKQTPEAKPEKQTSEAKPEKQTSEAKPEKQTSEAKPEKQTPEAKPEKQTPEAKPEKQTPEAKPEKQTPEAKPEKQTLGWLLQPYQALPAALAEITVRDLTLDSREVREGTVFAALQGGTQHGIRYAQSVCAQGAVAILYDPSDVHAVLPTDIIVPVVAVADLRAKLGALATRFYRQSNVGGDQLRMIGVTGTNGKTSSVQLLSQALTTLGQRCGTIGTLGVALGADQLAGERTTPDVITLQKNLAWLAARGAQVVAMEVSSHALDQKRVDGVQFELALLTNLTRDHLDYHGTMEAYGAAKATLFSTANLKHAVLNIDDALGQALLAKLTPGVSPHSYGTGANAAVRATDIVLHDQGAEFLLTTPWGARQISSPLLGRFNVLNVLAVTAALLALGYALDALVPVIAKLTPVHGRMTKIDAPIGHAAPLVVVDYAHTPDALTQVLGSLREHTRGRLICVFGCGGDRDAGKRPLMAASVDQAADVAIVTNDNPRTESQTAISGQIMTGFKRLHATVEHNREQAIATAIASAKPGDVVLIAGKGHENTQEIMGQKFAFDDCVIASRCVQHYHMQQVAA